MRLIAAMLDCCCRSSMVLHATFGLASRGSCPELPLTRRRTRSMICGNRCMDLRSLVEAVLRGDLLTARQWIADARRELLIWTPLPYPRELVGRELTVAAGLAELLADRAGAARPRWT